MGSDSWRAEQETGPKGKEDMLLQEAKAEQRTSVCLSLDGGDWGGGCRWEKKMMLSGSLLRRTSL